ncbi:MAG TPA: PspC domain-containing protein [Caulobacterales bacterium]|nr:PspC domain-containing protein [Caulobacterales bacterium]
MERVVTINLNGNPYQLDESAYDALRAYLERAGAALEGNPDKAEIIRDLEQAVADKCAPYLSSAKSVVSSEDMTKILEEMGPVEGEGAANAGAREDRTHDNEGGAPKKRLYRVADDARIAGVCGGIGAYFNIDSNIIRLLFIVLAIVTHGFWLLVYVAMMFLIPSAQTSEEWAAAHGIPFNAQQVIDEAKRQYRDFAGDGPPWSASWKWQRRAWRRNMRERARAFRRGWAYPTPPTPQMPTSAFGRLFGGLFAFIFAIVGAGLLIAFLLTLFSLVTTGAVVGWVPPIGMPLWVAIIVVCIVFGVLNGLVHSLQGISWSAMTGYPHGRYHDSGLGGLILLIFVGWLFYTYVPEARGWMDHAWIIIQNAFREVASAFRDAFN